MSSTLLSIILYNALLFSLNNNELNYIILILPAKVVINLIVICWAKQTKPENQIIYICDFRRGMLNGRFCARIQHLFPDHKYKWFDSQTSAFWLLKQINEEICGRKQE